MVYINMKSKNISNDQELIQYQVICITCNLLDFCNKTCFTIRDKQFFIDNQMHVHIIK